MKIVGWTSKVTSDSTLDAVDLEGETFILCDPFEMEGGVEYYLRFEDGRAKLFQLIDETPMVQK